MTFYAEDSPVWKAEPTHEQCRELISHIIGQAMSDANGGIDGYSTVYLTEINKRSARAWMGSEWFLHYCDLLGLNPSVVMNPKNLVKKTGLRTWKRSS